MILANRKRENLVTKYEYRVKDIYKDSNGKLDSFLVEISCTNKPSYEVILDSHEVCLMSKNLPAAYSYIEKASAGFTLVRFNMRAVIRDLLDKYRESLIDENGNVPFFDPSHDYYMKGWNSIPFDSFCSAASDYYIPYRVAPRYSRRSTYDNWYDYAYGNSISDESCLRISDFYETYEVYSLWIPDDMIEAIDECKTDEERYKILTKCDEASYAEALKLSRTLFEERHEKIMNREPDSTSVGIEK